jgi:hypothetical protein
VGFVRKVLWPNQEGHVVTNIGLEQNAPENVSLGLKVARATPAKQWVGGCRIWLSSAIRASLAITTVF